MIWLEFFAAPAFGALIGFGVWYFQTRLERIRRAKQQLHDERRKIYLNILDPFIRVLAGLKTPREMQNAIKKLNSFDYKKTAVELNLYGSDNVVRAFNEMMQHIYAVGNDDIDEKPSVEILRLWGALLLEIRKNLGAENTSLTERDMLESQITDISRLLP